MFRIINRKGFWKRFFLNLLYNVPLFILVRYFISPESMTSMRGLIFMVLMPLAISFAHAISQTKTAIMNEDDNEGLEYQPKPFSSYVGMFFFAIIFLIIVFGLFLLIAIPFIVFIWDEPLSFEDWKRYILLIPVLAFYVALSDWIANRVRRGKKPY